MTFRGVGSTAASVTAEAAFPGQGVNGGQKSVAPPLDGTSVETPARDFQNSLMEKRVSQDF